MIPPTASRLERYFPLRMSDPALVLLVNPAQDCSVPPLDLLKLSAFLRRRGYAPVLQKGNGDTTSQKLMRLYELRYFHGIFLPSAEASRTSVVVGRLQEHS